MDGFAEGVVAGLAVSTTISVMYVLNKTVLKSLVAVNVAIAKALVRLVLPPPPELEECECDCDCDNCKNEN